MDFDNPVVAVVYNGRTIPIASEADYLAALETIARETGLTTTQAYARGLYTTTREWEDDCGY